MRRVRRPLPSPPVRISRAPRLRGGERVTVVVAITAEVSRGDVTESSLAEWVAQAVDYYHRFRAGNMGFNADAAIRVPTVEEV